MENQTAGPTPAETTRLVDSSGEDATQLVTFLLKDEEFGFDIMSVQEIIRLPKMAKLPQTPSYVEGISNLRGGVLPVLDIRERFGMKREARTDRSRVLVIDIDGKRTGLLVDSVRQVVRVGRSEFEPPPAAIRNQAADYIDGVVTLESGKRIIIALNARRVCSPADRPQQAPGQDRGRQANAGAAPSQGGHGHEEQGKGGEVHQLVSFQVGGEEFAFPMEHVREILRVQTPKEVPGAPEHLLGVLTVRGKILPIVDLRRLMQQRSFAADLIAACRQAAAGYQAWLDRNGTGAEKEEWQQAAGAAEQLRQWLASVNSSSQALTETLAKLRGLNEQLSKQAGSRAHDHLDARGREALGKELTKLVKQIGATLDTFEVQAEGNSREDQRIIVVDSNGLQLGLVVDHVNEVLNVAEDTIEGPPNLASQGGVSLSGIAKLNDGNRLILLLATDNLVDHGVLSSIDHAGAAKELATAAGKKEDSKESGQNRDDLQLVTFLLGEEEYGIPIASVQEIDRLSKITQTPKAPRFVEGVTNLRGEVIPVLNTRTLFALEPRAADDRTRVIIVDLGGAKTGLVVDSVRQVLTIAQSNIAPPPPSISTGAEGQFISGIGKVEDGKRMIVLLDVGRVLTRVEQNELVAMGHPAHARAG